MTAKISLPSSRKEMLSVDLEALDVDRNEAMNAYLKTDLDRLAQPAMPSFSMDIPLG